MRQNLDSSIHQAWENLHLSPEPQITQAFLKYCSLILTACRNGQMTSGIAARYIARTMFVPGVDDDPVREAITMYAGELEVPQSSADSEKRWNTIERLMRELE